MSSRQIEDYPDGYPRFAALIASHSSFQFCRQFLDLRARLILLKQDNLVLLENELNELDEKETRRLWLGSCRMDKNAERLSLFKRIDESLADYDCFLERHRNVMQLELAPKKSLQSLKNWIDGKGCIARGETSYLSQSRDLRALAPPEEEAMIWIENLLEYLFVAYRRTFSEQSRLEDQFSRDLKVHIFSNSTMRQITRVLLAPLVTALLLTPVVICNFLGSLTNRLIVVVFATSFFVATLACTTRGKTVELIAAGATYTTVLVVFISNNDLSN